MRLADVDDQELGAVLVLIVKIVERGNLPAKGRSSVAPEDQHHGPFSAEGIEAHFRASVGRLEGENRRVLADVQLSGARSHPQRLKREHHKRYGREFRHERTEGIGRLPHSDGQRADQYGIRCHNDGNYFQKRTHSERKRETLSIMQRLLVVVS